MNSWLEQLTRRPRPAAAMVGWHLDAFGIKGNGQEVTFRVADIFTLRAGQITAHWEVADTGPLMQLAARGMR